MYTMPRRYLFGKFDIVSLRLGNAGISVLVNSIQIKTLSAIQRYRSFVVRLWRGMSNDPNKTRIDQWAST